MRRYVNEIVNIISEQLDINGNAFFRLDHFVHPEVYLNVYLHFKQYAQERNLKFTAKLAKEKYDLFSNENSKGKLYENVLEKLMEEKVVSSGEQMTKWRNLFAEEKGLVILMGTESVEDKGGLADFYCITPRTIEEKLNGEYYRWFSELIDISDNTEKNLINNFFKSVFQYIPCDLFKLSMIVDEVVKKELNDAEKIVEFVASRFSDYFGLPNIKSIDAVWLSKLKSNKRMDIIDKAVKFITRTDYKEGVSEKEFKKIEDKFEQFEQLHPELITNFQDEILLEFNSFSEFKEAVFDFIKGKNIDLLRGKLSNIDFNLLEKILNIRVSSGSKSTKDKVKKIHGSPLQAYAKILIDSVESDELINESIDIKIRVTEVVLTDTINDDEHKFDKWHDLCISLGGIVDYINQELDEEVNVSYVDNQDPFTLQNFKHINIKADTNTERLSKIYFETYINDKVRKEYVWNFSPYEYWLQAFSHTKFLKELIDTDEVFLPIFYSKGILNLLASTDSESFHFYLRNLFLEYTNVFSLFPSEVRNSVIFTKLYQLTAPFLSFVQGISENGLYNTISGFNKDDAIMFVSKYVEVINDITEKIESLRDEEKNYLHLVVNLLLLVPSKDEAENKLDLTGAVVPPYHPAMLEKIIEQQAFQRKGFAELIQLAKREKLTKNFILKRMEKIDKQSTIISGVDIIYSSNNASRVTRDVFGYYALYGKGVADEVYLNHPSFTGLGRSLGEDFDSQEVLSETSSSQLVFNHMKQYVQTFPSNVDSLSVCFINFEQLQIIVAALHKFIEEYKGSFRYVNLKIHIISPLNTQHGKRYLSFWLDNFFSEDDNVNIETYYSYMDIKNVSLNDWKRTLDNYDIVFYENILETAGIDYERTWEKSINPSDTRFPMTFHPLPASRKDRVRNISISQKQFQASFSHSQLLFWIEQPYSEKDIYRVERKLILSDPSRELLNYLHKIARWVVTIDTCLDKTFYDRENIISFSTGEGPFGELNVAVSSSPEVKNDICSKLKSRLQSIFTSWDLKTCEQSASYCVKKSSLLDGIKVLKALNPYNYEIHNFLSSLLSVYSLEVETVNDSLVVRNYISLDSYQHWFHEGKMQHKLENRPDFLLLEIDRNGLQLEDVIKIKATLVECKMGKESASHVEKGITQLEAGVQFLKSIFDPSSEKHDRRYWYSQLYRLLSFSPVYITNNPNDKETLNKSLLKIIEGKFEIEWNCVLLTYWLDYNQEVIGEEKLNLKDSEISYVHKSFGQIYIQKHLLPQDLRDGISFVDIDQEEIELFADDRDDYQDGATRS